MADPLYMLLMKAGIIVGTFGPLPYGEGECYRRAEEKLAELRVALAEHPQIVWPAPDLICKHSAERPKLGEK